MYKTKEIRWFFDNDNQHIREWFKQPNLNFDCSEERRDLYLNCKSKRFNIKLRDNRIEIKQRESCPIGRTNLYTAFGYSEKWMKWSFSLQDTQAEYAQLSELKKNEWVEVAKNRLTLTFVDVNGKLEIKQTAEGVESGCQIEYSKVAVKNKISYTLGFEWFGKEKVFLDDALLCAIFGDTKLTLNQSMGYAEFLKRKEL
ncbi:hypothetical protein Q4603_20095 [Zobellia galactanivorans]|uniref:hypothetical protein n=1 Tax=Zobellia galactanivorans (strain DSM 12802 / CCUG 47099 / CIP 106680 / NCIMB 13871 / Dsij) TaxID=63186 RepID=UPI001C06CAB2|nr:hypothetical protein [Zobellia galactanivorans]MBU3025207.1 hypothetical protein [Zobellia galactanivorans]MDO6810934.1 hypothetical protein [Zobellia galactanivorans]